MLFHDNIHGTDCKDSICTCCSVADRSSLWHEEEVSVLTDRLYSAPYSAYWTFCLAKHSMMHDLPDGVGSSQPQMPGSYLQFPACMRLQIYRGLHNNAEQNGRNPWHVLFRRPGLAAVPVISRIGRASLLLKMHIAVCHAISCHSAQLQQSLPYCYRPCSLCAACLLPSCSCTPGRLRGCCRAGRVWPCGRAVCSSPGRLLAPTAGVGVPTTPTARIGILTAPAVGAWVPTAGRLAPARICSPTGRSIVRVGVGSRP